MVIVVSAAMRRSTTKPTLILVMAIIAVVPKLSTIRISDNQNHIGSVLISRENNSSKMTLVVVAMIINKEICVMRGVRPLTVTLAATCIATLANLRDGPLPSGIRVEKRR